MLSNPYPIEVQAPDIAPYRHGNTGVDYVTTLKSGRSGPHAMVAAVIHGNEVCGAIVLDELLKEGIRPTRGKLTLAFCNVAAYRRFDPADPNGSRQVEEDINRVWAREVLDGTRDTPDLKRARELRPIVDQAHFLLDIHSLFFPIRPLMIAGPLEKSARLARDLGYPEFVVTDQGHKEGRRMRDYGAFGSADSPRTALLVECGQHWAKATVNVCRETVVRFLRHLDVVDRAWAEAKLPARATRPQRFIKVSEAVTIKTDRFAFDRPFEGYELIAKAGTVIAHDGDAPVTTPYDDCVLVMPSHRLLKGRTAVRLGRFVDPPAD